LFAAKRTQMGRIWPAGRQFDIPALSDLAVLIFALNSCNENSTQQFPSCFRTNLRNDRRLFPYMWAG
jgi:hypothetical protein